MGQDDASTPWVQQLCHAARELGNRSFVEMFEVARPHLDEPDFEALVAAHLESEPELVDLWERFSGDNRATPASYFDGTTVGRYDGQHQDVLRYTDRIEACADFIHRRAVEVLTDRRLVKD